MPRPELPEANKRKHTINMAVSAAELKILRDAAGDRPTTTVVRNRVFGSPGSAQVGLTDEERKALFDLRGMARNLNTLTIKAHVAGLGKIENELGILASDLRKLIDTYVR